MNRRFAIDAEEVGTNGLPTTRAALRVAANSYTATNFLGHGTVNPKANEPNVQSS